MDDLRPPAALSYLTVALAAACAGGTAATITNPLDTLRTRVQVHPTPITVRQAFRMVIDEGGVTRLWRGASARVLSMAPTTALLLTSYEFLKHLSRKDA